MTERRRRSRLATGLAASLVAHALAVAALWIEVTPPELGAGGSEASDELTVDVHLAPEAPEAFEPAAPEVAEDDGAGAEVAPEPEPEPAEEPEPDEGGALVLDEPDAGVDAGAVASAGMDAGVDAGVVASAAVDAGMDAGVVAGAAAADAGVVAGAGATGAATGDAGTGTGAAVSAGSGGSDAPAWSRIVHADHAPPGDHIAVLIRFDRLRGTEWAERVAAVLAPMPDYRSIIGGRDVALAELFDLLWITSSDPRQVTATNLAARSTVPAARLQSFLDHRRAPVTWSAARGGTLGTRRPSPLVVPGDPRVYLTLAQRWVLLAAPAALGPLAEPGSDEPPAPTWVRKLPELEAATDEAEKLAVLLSASGLPSQLVVPRVGALPAPDSAVVALDIDPQGFLVRGTLRFGSARAAAAFERELARTRQELLGSWSGRAILAGLSAHNALEQLTMRRSGPVIAISTSLSIADARAVMRVAGDWTARFFDPAARR